ncbi:MAG: hypothetical protein JWR26_4853 [Pedosphaera sp.]|nr:hypothetical protein [Pedosphaera sp.]
MVIAGGAGYLGRVLAEHFVRQSRPVVILSRHQNENAPLTRYISWDGKSLGPWANELEGSSMVINLAGRTVNCRYNDRNKQQIYDSRLIPTRILGQAIAACANPPRVWINSSSATIYRHALDRSMDEATGEIGTGFSVDVCLKWEQALSETLLPRTRKVALRSAIVFGPGRGGAMEAFHRLVKLGLGGTMGAGTQYVSWVHSEDFARSVQWIAEHEELEGPVNCASPNPLPNAEFMRVFRRVCHQPVGLPAARWMLEIGAFLLRTETELLLKSRRVVPGKLIASGFQLKHPNLADALQDIIRAGRPKSLPSE